MNRMRILWFEVTRPQRYKRDSRVIGGWQDALEEMLVGREDIELIIAFEGEPSDREVRVVDGITYVPMPMSYSFMETLRMKWTWDVNVTKLLPQMMDVVGHYHPDLIHVFGTEWPFGLIAEYVDVPVVIHIQGAIVPYSNALYPPGYDRFTMLSSIPWWNLKSRIGYHLSLLKNASWERNERKVWKIVKNYMGRTEWDHALSSIMHPGRNYYHVDEALRSTFSRHEDVCWKLPSSKKIRLLTTGCSTFWKGPDMLLKTARLLTESRIEFEWLVAGLMPPLLKKTVERHEGTSYEANGVKFLGYVAPEKLADLLCNAMIYVHTAYIENSPNSLCEAQALGVPIVSTNVGGISTLVENGLDGILVPANDPWQMAETIIELSRKPEQLASFSQNAREKARKRHDRERIIYQLLSCYQAVLGQKEQN